MNIFFVTPYVPDPIRVRPYQLIRALVSRGHRVMLFTVWNSAEERDAIEVLRELGVEVQGQYLPSWRSGVNALRAVPSTTSLQAAYCWQPAMARLLEEATQKHRPDVVHVEHLRGARYGLQALDSARDCGERVPVVWDSVDCISHLFEQAARQSRSLKGRLMTRLDLERTRRYEGWLVHQFDRVLVTSATDRDALLRLAEAAEREMSDRRDASRATRLSDQVAVLPNGVDLEHFRPNGEQRKQNRVMFTGKMSYHANVTAAVQFVEEIMPQVWARRSDSEAWIVGKDPSAEVRRLAQDGNPNDLAKGRVVVTGTVPDIVPYLHEATVAVAPVPYGAGIQNKVLEAMSCGTPVVASPQAVSALRVRDRHDLLVADTVEKFSDDITYLLGSSTVRDSIGDAGRRYVALHHSWQSIAAELEDIYADAIQRVRYGSRTLAPV